MCSTNFLILKAGNRYLFLRAVSLLHLMVSDVFLIARDNLAFCFTVTLYLAQAVLLG